jgi:hypothetical protein
MNPLSIFFAATAMAAGLGACADYPGSNDSQRNYAYTRAACTERANVANSDTVRRARFDSCMNSRGWSGSMGP